MTAYEFEQCRQLAEKWWPGITWTLDRDTVRDFDRISLTAGRKAIDVLKKETDDYPPNLAKFLRACKAAQGELPKVAENPSTCSHGPWAVLSGLEAKVERERLKRPDDGLRLGVCVGCHTESWGEFPTVGEAEGGSAKGEAA